jgi:beta-glucosidase
VRLRNAGDRRGREIVQVYAAREDSAVERPVRWLVGFAAVDAEAGDEATATVELSRRAFEHWDGGWTLEAGTFALSAGSSSAVLPLTAELDVRA